MPQAPYIASTVPAKVIITDGQTNLFRYAAREFGDALLAWQIADLNALWDFWPDAEVPLAIPQSAYSANDGIRPN
jgi:hypothetical protein